VMPQLDPHALMARAFMPQAGSHSKGTANRVRSRR
jgi:hypothetical protein